MMDISGIGIFAAFLAGVSDVSTCGTDLMI